MDFGLFVACHRLHDGIAAAEVFDQALEMVELADDAGFRTAWFPEHHLIHYISCPSPLMLAVKAAARTRRIRLGTAILVIPYYDPLRLAGEIGMADHLTDGRLEIGIGRGAFEYEFHRFGIDERIGAARLRVKENARLARFRLFRITGDEEAARGARKTGPRKRKLPARKKAPRR